MVARSTAVLNKQRELFTHNAFVFTPSALDEDNFEIKTNSLGLV